MGKGNYLGGSTIIKTFWIEGARRSKITKASRAEVKGISSSVTNSQIISENYIEKIARKNRERIKNKNEKKHIENMQKNLSENSEKNSNKYSSHEISEYILKNFPKIPISAVKSISKRGSQSIWTNYSLQQCVEECIKTHIMFDVLGHMKLIDHEIPREIALKITQNASDTILNYWKNLSI